MNKSIRNSLLLTMGIMLSISAIAKDIKVSDNNTPYSPADVQKLASTAVKMGVTEPVSLRLNDGNLAVTGSSKTSCVIKVGSAATPQIAGISCK